MPGPSYLVLRLLYRRALSSSLLSTTPLAVRVSAAFDLGELLGLSPGAVTKLRTVALYMVPVLFIVWNWYNGQM